MFSDRIKSLYVVNPEIIGKKVVFYGGGLLGHGFYRTLVNAGLVNLIGIYDNYMAPGTKIFDTKILSRKELESLDRNTPIIIATNRIKNFQEIAEDLLELKFNLILTDISCPSLPVVYDEKDTEERMRENEKKIRQARSFLADEESVKVFDNILKYKMTNKKELLWEICTEPEKQYFPEGEIFNPSAAEVFIDAGCLNAGTIGRLKRWTSDTYAKVYAFEPSSRDKVVCDEYIKFYKYRAECTEAGLYSRNGHESFAFEEYGGSRVGQEGTDLVKILTLDDFMRDKEERITYIKMDIEGSELEALKGAVGRIETDHPKLAISVYHKLSHLWEILLWIHSRFPAYQFFLRHYAMTDNETVLYARWEEER